MLLWLLIFANLIGGFIASSTYIVSKIPKLKDMSKTLNSFKLPIGITVFVISVLNIFNFWAIHYPKLTLIAGLITGFVLSVELLNKVEIDEGIKAKIFDFANKFQVPAGLLSLVIGLVWVLRILMDVIGYIL
ncbi:MAG: hypothetical protein KKH98_06090 [Spirochaetes bacterium]|nr:hypothetical protein [Spirochaetota bacterium]